MGSPRLQSNGAVISHPLLAWSTVSLSPSLSLPPSLHCLALDTQKPFLFEKTALVRVTSCLRVWASERSVNIRPKRAAQRGRIRRWRGDSGLHSCGGSRGRKSSRVRRITSPSLSPSQRPALQAICTQSSGKSSTGQASSGIWPFSTFSLSSPILSYLLLPLTLSSPLTAWVNCSLSLRSLA